MGVDTRPKSVPAPTRGRCREPTDRVTLLGMNTQLSRGAIVAAGTIAAVGGWAVITSISDRPTVHMGGIIQPVGPGAAAVSALVAGLAGWALLAMLERWTNNARRTWTIVALAFLVVSLAGPLGSGADVASIAALVVLHLLVAAVVISGLRRSARAIRTERSLN